MYLFFDVETNGLPKNWKAPVTDLDNWPRVIQLAYAAYNSEGKLFASANILIKPDGWIVPNEKFWIDNGFSQEQSEKEGKSMPFVLSTFISFLNDAKYLIAHNMAFDNNVVGAEMLRYKVMPIHKPTKICTMQASTDLLKLPNTNGFAGFKFPKLIELHQFLFNADFEGAHDALNDVLATAKCFFELKKRGLINLE